jgi:hypothetical protein
MGNSWRSHWCKGMWPTLAARKGKGLDLLVADLTGGCRICGPGDVCFDRARSPTRSGLHRKVSLRALGSTT